MKLVRVERRGMSAASAVGAAPVRAHRRNDLVVQNLSLVRGLAQRLVQRLPSQVSIEDLTSAGVLGLIEAAGRYQPSLGVPFQAFARRRVQGAMLDALRDLDWAPRSLRRLRRDVDSATSTVRARTGREPERAAIAAELGLSADEFERTLEQLRTLETATALELDAPTGDGMTLIEFCVDSAESALESIEREELRTHLARAVEQLPDRERHILALYYEEEMTLAEIGAAIGVCESRVCQLRGVAVARLRTLLRTSLGLPAQSRDNKAAVVAETARRGHL